MLIKQFYLRLIYANIIMPSALNSDQQFSEKQNPFFTSNKNRKTADLHYKIYVSTSFVGRRSHNPIL